MSNLPKYISWTLLFLLSLLIIFAVIILRTPKPCQESITYRINRVDDRFGLTRQEFALAVNMAAAMWGKPLGREIFREDSSGAIEINLIYDYRQESSDKLKLLNYKIGNTKTSYDDLKVRLDNLQTEYNQMSAELAGNLSVYNSRLNAFNANVEYWNRQGGVRENVHKNLMQERDELNSLREKMQVRQDDIRRLTDTIDSMVVVINEIATNINLDLVSYRNTGDALGREFCEGLYESRSGRQTINIYQFDNDNRLTRVLAHEFGHALKLNHSSDASAVMYRLIQSDVIELSPDDIAALQKRCDN